VRLAEVLERGDDHRQAESADEDVENAGDVAQRQRTLYRPALRTTADIHVELINI